MFRLGVNILIVILGIFSTSAHSLRFDLESGHTKCIAEEIKMNAMSVGKYSVVNPSEGNPLPDSLKITARVNTPYGNSAHYAEKVESGNFAFTSTEDGDYMACFWAPDYNPSTIITVDFEWKSGVAAKDWSNVAKKGQIDVQLVDGSSTPVEGVGTISVMELELKKLEETVKAIHEEMFYLREREEEMQELNRTTNSRMAWLSFLSLFICLSVAGLQLWHLKTFFERKKLL